MGRGVQSSSEKKLKAIWELAGDAMVFLDADGLLDCNDAGTEGEAIEVLTEAMQLGSPHAAYDLGTLFLREARSPQEVQAGFELLQLAAAAGHPEAEALLRELPPMPGKSP